MILAESGDACLEFWLIRKTVQSDLTCFGYIEFKASLGSLSRPCLGF